MAGQDIVDLMINRASQPRLDLPAPSAVELNKVYQCALRAPDHMRLKPWRYLVIEGEAREKLGQIFSEAAMKAKPDLSDAQKNKFLNMPLRAPMMIVGIARTQKVDKVPREEQLISAGVGMGYMLLALQAMGYGGMWRTGDMASDTVVRERLEIAEHEEIIGFLYIGTPSGDLKVPAPSNVDDFVTNWS